MPRFTFPKNEKLCSQKEIDQLFKEGKSIHHAPIRIVWLEVDLAGEAEPVMRIMFAVSKKQFARAVDRNRIKRLMREAYRLGRHQWQSQLDGKRRFNLALVFTGKELPEFTAIQNTLAVAFENWLKKVTRSI